MMSSALLLTVLLGLSYSSPDKMKKLQDHMKTWNCEVSIWGERNVIKHKQMEAEIMEKCMLQPVNPLIVGHLQPISKALPLMSNSGTLKQSNSISLNYLQSNTFSNGYAPFHNHLGKIDAGDLEEFMGHAAMFNDGVESKMSNLSCVLQSFGVIDTNFKMNRNMFTNNIWTMQDLSATDNLANPVWRAKMTTMFNDCIDMAESIPQALLDNHPLTRMMGPLARFMKFNTCKKVIKSLTK